MQQPVRIIVLISLMVSVLSAGSFKKYAGEFLYLGVGGRAMGMGGAATGVADDVTAGYWNPAGLVDADGLQFQFMHSKQFISSIQYNYLAVSRLLPDKSALALSVTYLTVNDIKDSRDAYDFIENRVDPSRVKLFNTGDYSVLLSYARPFRSGLSYGGNVKFIYRDYEVESALGIGFDAGLKYHFNEQLTLGMMLRDITTTMMSWSTGEREFITPSARMGVSYTFNISSIDLRLQPAADFNILFENREYASQFNLGAASLDSFWGMDVTYKNTLSVRLGIDELERLNAGVGLKIPKITFDYSFTGYENELGNVHRISFHLQFLEIFN